MSKKEVTVDELIALEKKGMNFQLDQVEIKATVTVKDRNGNVKSTFEMRNEDATTKLDEAEPRNSTEDAG